MSNKEMDALKSFLESAGLTVDFLGAHKNGNFEVTAIFVTNSNGETLVLTGGIKIG